MDFFFFHFLFTHTAAPYSLGVVSLSLYKLQIGLRRSFVKAAFNALVALEMMLKYEVKMTFLSPT